MHFQRPTLKHMLEAQNWPGIKNIVSKWHVADIADFLYEMETEERSKIFDILEDEIAAEVFSFFEIREQEDLLERVGDKKAKNLIAHMAPDDRIELLEDAKKETADRIVMLLSAEDLQEAKNLLKYPESSAGRLMTPDFLTLNSNVTVEEALQTVKKEGRDIETVRTIYVVDEERKPKGVISLRRLVLSDPNCLVEEVMNKATITVSAYDDQEEVAQVVNRYDLPVIPVVDLSGALVGIVTADDVFEASQEEVTEDFHRGAAVSPLKTELKSVSPFHLYRSRILWLLILSTVYLISAGIMKRYEDIISTVVSLVFFLPLLIDSAGNAGSQSATLVVRALGTGDVGLKDWGHILLKELGVSLVLGLSLGAIVLGVGMVGTGTAIALIVGITMFLNIVVTSLIGALIPLVLERFGLDPATAGSPLVTSIADITGVVIYFSVAARYLGF